MADLSKAGIEPSLHDLMNDPVLQLVLKRDGLSKEAVSKVVLGAKERLSGDKLAA